MTLSRRYEGPHIDHPSRHDVEVALQALDIREEQEREAIRKFWKRERRGIKLGLVLKAFYWAAIGLGFLWVAWVLADAALDWLWQGLGGR